MIMMNVVSLKASCTLLRCLEADSSSLARVIRPILGASLPGTHAVLLCQTLRFEIGITGVEQAEVKVVAWRIYVRVKWCHVTCLVKQAVAGQDHHLGKACCQQIFAPRSTPATATKTHKNPSSDFFRVRLYYP